MRAGAGGGAGPPPAGHACEDTTLNRFPRAPLLLLALLALALALGAAPARAQQEPVSLEVRAGYDGAGLFPVGHWFPIAVVAANDGPDLDGAIELRLPGEGAAVFRQAVELPRGARKQVTLPVTIGESVRGAELLFVADGAEVARRTVRLSPLSAEQLALGVLSSDPGALGGLALIAPANGATTVVARLDPALLPADPMLLAGLDAIFLHDLPTAELSEGQRAALAGYARLGGTLVVGGGPNAERTVPGLAELLPVDVGALSAGAPAASLTELSGNVEEPPPASLTANAVALRPGARALDTGQLVTQRDLGAGQVIFAAFDLAVLRTWEGEPALWGQLVRQEPRALLGYSYRWRSENLLRDALQLPALRLPSTFTILGLILLYIVVVGPLNFLVLRRLRRVELAWVTTPALVAIFLALSYGSSVLLRGTSAQISQLAVVQGFEGQPSGQATAFIGVFSPQRRSYELRFGPDTLVTPGTFEGFRFTSVAVSSDEAGAAVPDLLVDVSALRTLVAEQPAAEVPAVASSLQADGAGVRGELRNQSGLALSDAVVVRGDSASYIGELAAGAAAQVSLAGNNNFPEQLTFASGGLFNHDRVLYSLFGYDRFAIGDPTFQGSKGLPETDGVYLLAWADRPALPVTIDGADTQQGQTLYIIRLNP